MMFWWSIPVTYLLIGIQNRYIKLIGRRSTSTDAFAMYTGIKLHPFPNIQENFSVIKFCKYVILNADISFNNKIISIQIYHYFNIRFKSNNCLNNIFFLPIQNLFFYRSIRLWNKLTVALRNTISLHIFKQ